MASCSYKHHKVWFGLWRKHSANCKVIIQWDFHFDCHYHYWLFKQFPWCSAITPSWIYNLKFAYQWLSGPHLNLDSWKACVWIWENRNDTTHCRQKEGVLEGPQIYCISVFLSSQASVFQSLFLLENAGQTWGQRVNNRISRAENWLDFEFGI